MGPTGTGKSCYINKFLRSLPIQKFNNILLSFSAQTSSQLTQQIIDQRLDKRRKGIYGPKVGVQCLVFVDDVNMPHLDKYGAQPPIELLR
jgi:dynein heavy chain, axonemal